MGPFTAFMRCSFDVQTAFVESRQAAMTMLPAATWRTRRSAVVAVLWMVALASCVASGLANAPAAIQGAALAPRPTDAARTAVETVLRTRNLHALKEMDPISLGNEVYRALYVEGEPKPTTLSQSQYEQTLLSAGHVQATAGWFSIRSGALDHRDLVRIYLNVMPDAVSALVADLLGKLRLREIRFAMKLPADLASFRRSSSAVLYVERGDYVEARAHAVRFVESCGSCVAADVPPFTKRVARGVGVADEPSTSSSSRPHYSHGTVRAQLVAEALTTARADATAEELAASVRERFASHNLDPLRPWLRAGKLVDDL